MRCYETCPDNKREKRKGGTKEGKRKSPIVHNASIIPVPPWFDSERRTT